MSGRMEDSLIYFDPQGGKHTIHSHDMEAFFVPGMRQFQFEQTTPNSLLLRIVIEEGYSDSVLFAEKKLNDLLVNASVK